MEDNVDILNRIIEKCEGEISVTVNTHKSYYQSIEQYFSEHDEKVDPDILAVMKAMDRMVCVQVYPNTPIGFFIVYHYSLSMALSEILEILDSEKQ